MAELSFRNFRKRLLIELARVDEEHPGEEVDPLELATRTQLDFKPGWVRKAAQGLHGESLVKASFHVGGGSDGGCHMAISAYGLERVEEWLEEESIEPIFVRIDQETADIELLNSKLDELINLVRSSNEYAAKEPEDHQQVVAELEAGKRLVNAPRARLSAIRTVLGTPLKYLSLKFGDAAIATIAKTALKFLASKFGIDL